jgi:hypothetical protein
MGLARLLFSVCLGFAVVAQAGAAHDAGLISGDQSWSTEHL